MLIAIFGHADSSLSSAYKRRPHRRYQHLKYGKDSVSGVLESVLAQPITSKGLSLSRYFSSFAGMSIAFLVSVAVVDLIVQHFTTSFLDPTILLSSTGALLVVTVNLPEGAQ
jgi:hypothetical protein